MIIDDYAHHPTEIDATIDSAKTGWVMNKLIIIFQPHLYSRTKIFYKEFSKALSKADIIFLTDIYPSREKKITGVSSELILDQMDRNNTFLLSKKQIIHQVSKIVEEGDMIIIMGAGDIRDITDSVYDKIEMESSIEG